MIKNELRTGMRVVTSNGEDWVVIKDVTGGNSGRQQFVLCNLCSDGFLNSSDYTSDLKMIGLETLFNVDYIYCLVDAYTYEGVIDFINGNTFVPLDTESDEWIMLFARTTEAGERYENF